MFNKFKFRYHSLYVDIGDGVCDETITCPWAGGLIRELPIGTQYNMRLGFRFMIAIVFTDGVAIQFWRHK